MTLRSTLDSMLEELSGNIKKMVELSRSNIEANLQMFNNPAESFDNLLEQITNSDKKLRSIGDETEETVIKILSLQAPVGKDLRKTVSTFRIIYDLERVSRDSLHVYRYFRNYKDEELGNEITTDLFERVQGALSALLNLLDVFERTYFFKGKIEEQIVIKFSEEAQSQDTIIDDVFKEVVIDLARALEERKIGQDSENNALFGLRSLERSGDHCCNLIERSLYILDGQRHSIS